MNIRHAHVLHEVGMIGVIINDRHDVGWKFA